MAIKYLVPTNGGELGFSVSTPATTITALDGASILKIQVNEDTNPTPGRLQINSNLPSGGVSTFYLEKLVVYEFVLYPNASVTISRLGAGENISFNYQWYKQVEG